MFKRCICCCCQEKGCRELTLGWVLSKPAKGPRIFFSSFFWFGFRVLFHFGLLEDGKVQNWCWAAKVPLEIKVLFTFALFFFFRLV